MSEDGLRSLAGCTGCGGVSEISSSTRKERVRLRCPHCGLVLSQTVDHRTSRSRTAAFAISALILYPPAVLLPVLHIDRLGHAHETSIIDGISSLFRDGHEWLAMIVLICSVIIPLAKLLGMLWLASARIGSRARRRLREAIESVGRWGMLDVLLVAALVALVKLGDLVRIEPGPGAAIFAVMVVFSLLASACFDPRSIHQEKVS